MWLNNCPPDFKPSFYTRYMDDTFTLFDNIDQAHKFLNYLNEQHPSIKFTVELQKDNTLSFLDVLVRKKDNCFETDVYRKPTFTGLGMKFNSAISETYKYNLIHCLLERTFKIFSNQMNFNSSFNKLRKFFHQNAFPVNFIKKIIESKVNSLRSPKVVSYYFPKIVIYIKIPLISEVNNTNMRLEIIKLLGRFYPQINFKFIFNNQLSIESFFKFKDRIPYVLQSCVVYKFSCGQCSSTYIGETYRHLSTRIADHKGISVRTGQTLLNPPNSSIRDHALQAGHDINTNCFKIIHKSELKSINVSENTLIKKFSLDLNNQDASTKFNILG